MWDRCWDEGSVMLHRPDMISVSFNMRGVRQDESHAGFTRFLTRKQAEELHAALRPAPRSATILPLVRHPSLFIVPHPRAAGRRAAPGGPR